MGKRILLTVLRNGNETYYDAKWSVSTSNKPKVLSFDLDNAGAVIPVKAADGGGSAFRYYTPGSANYHTVYIAESPSAISVLSDASASTNLFAIDQNLTVAAAGANQGAATAITKYFNKVTSATASSAEGVVLPAASVNKVIVVQNADADAAVKVYPATGGKIDGGSANAAVTLAIGALSIYWCDGTNWWTLYTI